MSEEQEHNSLERSIGRIEGKIDGILERLDIINGRIGDGEKRLGKLEQFKGLLEGKEKAMTRNAATAGAGVGGIVSGIVWILDKLFRQE